MADQVETKGVTQDNANGAKSTPKNSRFRKSTVAGYGKDQLKRGKTVGELQLPSTPTMNSRDNTAGNAQMHHRSGSAEDSYLKSGKPEPVLPMFVQMNVKWDGVDKSWREASR